MRGRLLDEFATLGIAVGSTPWAVHDTLYSTVTALPKRSQGRLWGSGLEGGSEGVGGGKQLQLRADLGLGPNAEEQGSSKQQSLNRRQTKPKKANPAGPACQANSETRVLGLP